ncbi:MAG: hypothetical protein AB1696_18345 [Planctomycetota bacterium]
MKQRRVLVFAFAISVILHFLTLSSKEVMGFLLGPGELPKVEKDEPLVFDLLPPDPPKPKPKPEERKWFVDEKGNKEEPTGKTNLMGVEQSAARDQGPKDKPADGIPNLDGDSEMLATRDQTAMLGDTKPLPPVPALPAPPAPLSAEPMAAAKPEVPPPPSPKPAQPPAEPQPKPVKEVPAAPKETKAPPVKPEPAPEPTIAAASPEKKDIPIAEPKKDAPAEPAKPVEVAQLPQPMPAPAAPPAPPAPDYPAIPPRQLAKVKSMFPESSAGKEGEPSFNIKVDQYAAYYKHMVERLERTWLILRRYEAGMTTVGGPNKVKLIFQFKVTREGKIVDVEVVNDGGDPIIATEINRCIESTSLDPFPDFITEDELRVQPVIFFLYGY